MAVYELTILQSNLLGNTEIQVQESSGAGSLANILGSIGGEKFIMSSLNLWSNSDSQLLQPITLKNVDISGQDKDMVRVPQFDSYQFSRVLNNICTDKWEFTEDTKIEYKIEPNTIVKMNFNFVNKKEIRKTLSYTEQLKKAGSKNVIDLIYNQLGLKESEEISGWNGKPVDQFKECEEIKKKKLKKIIKITKVEYKYNKILIGAIFLTSFIFWSLTDDTKYKILKLNFNT